MRMMLQTLTLATLVFRSFAGLAANALDDPSFFPIAVWLQNPSNADKYRAAGINTYVGLWRGPTDAQVSSLKKAGMKIICAQNATALQHLDDPSIIAWMHGDEPDNAQSLGPGKGYGPPILPDVIQRDYGRMKQADPSRPILLNLGQGVAWDNYIGRGVRRNHPEDYPEYLKGCDIASFDIYPAVHDHPEVSGKLEFVPRGVERLVKWTEGRKRIWNCLECTRISNVKTKPTPAQVRSEAWMALIHGSRGLIYFVHQFKPEFREAALLDDPEMLASVTALNKQITGLARILNSPTIAEALQTDSTIATMSKRVGGKHYVFAVNMSNSPVHAEFKTSSEAKQAEVLDEGRALAINSGKWSDAFSGYGVHIYVIAPRGEN